MKYKTEDIDSLVKQMMPLASKTENDHNRGVAIYGAGFVGTWAAQYLRSSGAAVKHFIDRDPQKNGTTINGIPVILPSDPLVASYPTIYIAARHAVKDVQKAMANNNYNLLSFDGYYVIKNYQKFADIRDNYFSDDKSIETYNALLLAMLTSSTKSCRTIMEKDMYFGIPEFSGTFNEIFVDAGAFVGDSIERFIWENLGTFKHIYAFEPGHRQFLSLQQRMLRLSKEWALDDNSVTAVNAGLAAEDGRMTFSFLYDSPLRHGLTTGDHGTTSSDINSIEVYSLDSFLKGKPVTFIKADVEGMEMDLLRGAQATIRRNKPKMALCVYHYPSDLIEVAEFVKNLVPEYKFHIRQHAPIFGDFVLYCHCE
ncbi:FkbM family methyltransferase [Desulfobacula sp.]|uniref:FkbM family methyltransferase n=1 Tax=Desulfobacula sp. TaxID=2593537 RepID=UPI00262FDBF0|nr:FkbM family methyltransferase [Desulfobacula sp.]